MLITSHYYRANDTNLFSFAGMKKSIERERERGFTPKCTFFYRYQLDMRLFVLSFNDLNFIIYVQQSGFGAW